MPLVLHCNSAVKWPLSPPAVCWVSEHRAVMCCGPDSQSSLFKALCSEIRSLK
uniref:Uncharacterized protein n=1 Tax=Anguilla anguilla TaxID=7936 RepID=A0A0E9XPS0_ANGAN